ncbi:hypothetical protein [Bradyrhizobium sp. S3.9.1]|uniref:hypothetical protein n=1 Tax=Bradyrhizobium sp. S3.9.1 TaxID=3156431 RepID=UPI003399D61B
MTVLASDGLDAALLAGHEPGSNDCRDLNDTAVRSIQPRNFALEGPPGQPLLAAHPLGRVTKLGVGLRLFAILEALRVFFVARL